MEIYIQPSTLQGTLTIPPSKSHTLRALLFSLLGSGSSRLYNILKSPDVDAMLDAMRSFGAKIIIHDDHIEVEGGFSEPSDIIDAGNSGQVLRFIGAISALLPTYSVITGDTSVRSRRPIKPLLTALRQLGAIAESTLGNGYAPIQIKGPIYAGSCYLTGEDSQPVSALLMATSFLQGETEIFVDHPGETPWIDLTLYWLNRLGGRVTHENYTHYLVKGPLSYSGLQETIPGDFSTAAFPIVAALITGSSLKLEGLDPKDVQGDKLLIEILQKMGAHIEWENTVLHIYPSPRLQGTAIDINTMIDALPTLAVLGCFAEGTTILYNGNISRYKESDRIFSMCKELKKMGANIEELEDGLIIKKSILKGTTLDSHRDHRVALALAIAAMGAEGSSTIDGAESIQKSYDDFVPDFQKIGAKIESGLVRV